MTLRPYQIAVVDAAKATLAKHGSVVLQMPTGGGKTKAATAIVAEQGGGVWFICHRREIIRQASAAFTAAGIKHGIVAPDHPQTDDAVQIASVLTLARRIGKLPPPTLVVWDECHHVAAKSWASIREALPDALHLGLTATPERLDGKGLADWFGYLVCGPSIKSLVADGWLTPMRYLAPSVPDLTAAKMQAGDYSKKDTAAVMSSPVLIGDAVAEYQKHTLGKRAIAFCASVDASKSLVTRFIEAGVPAAHVDSTTPVDERDAAVADLRAGRILVLSNVEVFTEGFDLPDIDAAILLRPTKSLRLFLQMVGRSLRPAHGKERAVIFDHAGLWLDHGRPDSEWAWSLDGGAREVRMAAARDVGERLRRCPECKEVQVDRVPVCDCGYIFPTGREIGEFDGVLRLLTGELPEGCVSHEILAAKFNVSPALVRNQWIRKGLPAKDGYPVLAEAEKWVYSNVDLRRVKMHATRSNPPAGYMSLTQFCMAHGYKSRSGYWVKMGLPITEYGVPISEGEAWLADYLQSRGKRLGHKNNFFSDELLSKPDLMKRAKMSPPTVERLVNLGMPVNQNGRFSWDEIVKWALEQRPDKGFMKMRPFWLDSIDDFEPREAFRKRIGINYSRMFRLVSSGIPQGENSSWVHIQRGLEWVRDNTDIQIPPEAWPASNDNTNEAMEQAA